MENNIRWTPAAAINARHIGVEIADDNIDWDNKPHIFQCPDCQVVDPKAIKDDDGNIQAVVCRKCDRQLMYIDAENQNET